MSVNTFIAIDEVAAVIISLDQSGELTNQHCHSHNYSVNKDKNLKSDFCVTDGL